MSDQNLPPSPLAPTVSPLTEADPSSVNLLIAERLDEIFNKNPLKKLPDGTYDLSDADLRSMILHYRQERQRYMIEAQIKANAPPKARKAVAVPKSVADAMASTDDLL